jgi:hypothetical protein
MLYAMCVVRGTGLRKASDLSGGGLGGGVKAPEDLIFPALSGDFVPRQCRKRTILGGLAALQTSLLDADCVGSLIEWHGIDIDEEVSTWKVMEAASSAGSLLR